MKKLIIVGILYSGSALSDCYVPVSNFYGQNLTMCEIDVAKAQVFLSIRKTMGDTNHDATSTYEKEIGCQRKLKVDGENDFKKLKNCFKKAGNSQGLRALAEFYSAWKVHVNGLVDYASDRDYQYSVDQRREKLNEKYHILEALN